MKDDTLVSVMFNFVFLWASQIKCQLSQSWRAIVVKSIDLPHQRVAELQIFVQVIQAVEKVSHVPTQHGQHPVVAVLAHEVYEINSHLIHELPFGDAENLEMRGGKLRIYGDINAGNISSGKLKC